MDLQEEVNRISIEYSMPKTQALGLVFDVLDMEPCKTEEQSDLSFRNFQKNQDLNDSLDYAVA